MEESWRPNLDVTSFIAPGAVVLGRVTLGAGSSVWYQCVVRGDTEAITIGAGTNLQDGTIVHADPGVPCVVGERVSVGHRAILHGCVVEDGCLVGMGAILLNGVRLGAGSVVAAGAVLREGLIVPPGSLVVGVPGKVTREVDPALRERIARTAETYMRLAGEHRAGRFLR